MDRHIQAPSPIPLEHVSPRRLLLRHPLQLDLDDLAPFGHLAGRSQARSLRPLEEVLNQEHVAGMRPDLTMADKRARQWTDRLRSDLLLTEQIGVEAAFSHPADAILMAGRPT